MRATRTAQPIFLDVIILIILGEETILYNFLQPQAIILPQVQIFSSALCSQTPSNYVPPLMWQKRFRTHTKLRLKL
jgi:hypothetical protein